MKKESDMRVSIFIFSVVVLSFSGRGSVSQTPQAIAIDSVKEIREVRKIAGTYASSHILGTGGDQYLVKINLISSTEARAILGERDGGEDNKNAYTLNLKKGKKGWKIFSVEYIFTPTGKKQIDTLSPPFPHPNWKRGLKGTG